ncbi:MAG TPA: GNAT family N-acetyltransferase [Burkholderiales bacterium]|jgi:GNAT superfamily N-acetyltransferase|nr:GNAT family N-acetyltransferase [Burkholderiales bacterium]
MSLPPIELQRGDCPEIEAFLAQRIYEFNAQATGYFDGESYAAVQRDEVGAIIAGISGYTWGGVCFVSYLWVAQAYRGQGWGGALMLAAEQNAREKGCALALLSSHSFQSPGFYAHMGYEAQVSVRDHPVGHSDIFFVKRLARPG